MFYGLFFLSWNFGWESIAKEMSSPTTDFMRSSAAVRKSLQQFSLINEDKGPLPPLKLTVKKNEMPGKVGSQ